MAKKTSKGGEIRRLASADKKLKFGPGPLRQLFFVGLALAGIGIGYGAGFVLKKEQPRDIPAAESMRAPATAPIPVPAPVPAPAAITEPPLLPEGSNPAPGKPPRAYEEALPKEIIVLTGPPEENPRKAEMEEAPETKVKVAEPVKKETATVTPLPADTKPLPRIALVMDDLGIDKPRTARVIRLPGPLTLSFMTYATGLPAQTKAAREAGHELWMHIPMEPGSPDIDPGPNVLLTGIPERELLSALQWNLDQFSGYVGVNNHMGSRFTADKAGMMTIMRVLKKRGLFFLDSVTTGKTVGRKVAKISGVPFAGRNVFLDDRDDVQGIGKRLKEVENLALKTGTAIAIGHPREATLKALEAWLEKIEARGFRLVPLSAIIKSP